MGGCGDCVYGAHTTPMKPCEGGDVESFGSKLAGITGGGSGMGRELAVALAGEGCRLAISGPLWLGPLQSEEALAKMEKLSNELPVPIVPQSKKLIESNLHFLKHLMLLHEP